MDDYLPPNIHKHSDDQDLYTEPSDNDLNGIRQLPRPYMTVFKIATSKPTSKPIIALTSVLKQTNAYSLLDPTVAWG